MIKLSLLTYAKAVILLLGFSRALAQDDIIAGYLPVSDVVEHSELDLDTMELETCADGYNWTCALKWYTEGGHSVKGESFRTLQGFSKNAQEILESEKWYVVYKDFWDDPTYADSFTLGACDGSGDFADASNDTRSECCLKGAQYQNVWMYVIHELEDAISDCEGDDLEANNGGAHAWDEGWAFYAGSLEGAAGSDDGQHIYALAEKRCENFGTCTGDSDEDQNTGTAAVNTQLLELYDEGQTELLGGNCSAVVGIKEQIVDLMTVPLIQGMLRYFYLADPAVDEAAGGSDSKEAAELWAFTAAALPRIDKCNTDIASTIRGNADIFSTDGTMMSDGYEALTDTLQNVYSCLGIRCEDIGGYSNDEGATYVSGMEPCNTTIAGYVPSSNVVQHTKLDLDTAELEAYSDDYDWENAYTVYSEGSNSVKTGSNDIRTLQGFSTSAEEKLTGEKWYDVYTAYWDDDPAYADTFTGNACEGNGDFADASELTRSECCLKGAQYQNVWMYVIHELEDAISDCIDGNLDDNDGGPHAWDEGWAFYAGSLEGTAGSDIGQHIYTLAEKRCEDFGTCTGDSDGDQNTGTAAVNTQLLELFNEGLSELLELNCENVVVIKEQIVDLMTVPLIQGMLRYFYEASLDDADDKAAAELWAFSAAALPLINRCSADVAEAIRDNTDITSDNAPMKSDGYEALTEKLQTVYSCLGFTCEDVGGYLDDEESSVEGMEICDDSAISVTYAPIAGYTPVSNVVPHSELDLDTAELEECADAYDWECAERWYSKGGNSFKLGSETIRTIQGFSTSAPGKLDGEKWYDIYKAYWDDPMYADSFTGRACNGTGDFEDQSDATRSECCLKGAQYQNVWMYVIHELEDAIIDCNADDLDDNDGGPHAWDEGWAFYAGFLEGAEGTGDGQHIYALAEKRCENFGTCTGDSDGVSYEGTAAVNAELLELFDEGKGKLQAGECDDLDGIKEKIVNLMTVPLIQGMLRYFYQAHPDYEKDGNGDKEAAELWAFSAAALPRIDECDAGVADAIRDQTFIDSSSAPMDDGYESLKKKLESVYDCLGISCSDVGGILDDAEAGTYVSGMEPCRDEDDELPEWGVALIVIAAVGIVGMILFCVIRRRRGKPASGPDRSGVDGLGGFGVKAQSTI